MKKISFTWYENKVDYNIIIDRIIELTIIFDFRSLNNSIVNDCYAKKMEYLNSNISENRIPNFKHHFEVPARKKGFFFKSRYVICPIFKGKLYGITLTKSENLSTVCFSYNFAR